MQGTPGSPARLLWATSLSPIPVVFGNFGTLYLNRLTMNIQGAPAADASGVTSVGYTLPAGAAQVGSTLYFQGLFTTPRRLTQDWVRVTVLP
jgi:hypothetical protein